MKAILRNYGIRMTTAEKQVARATASDMVRTRGTAKVPAPPREIIVQAGPRGVLLSWSLPAENADDIYGWRIYKDDESTLLIELHDRGSKQHFVDCTAGTTPPTTNFFISSISALGKESRKVQVQGAATAETGAPSFPSSPPGYSSGGAGGGGTGGGTGGQNPRGFKSL